MGSENDRRNFKEYDYYLGDVRVLAIKEEDADYYTEDFNDVMDTLMENGNTVVGINTIIEAGTFHTVIDYVPNECIYWKGGEVDGGDQQILDEADDTKET